MKIAYASDLHTEFSNNPIIGLPELDSDTNVIVLAGDLVSSPNKLHALLTEFRERTDAPIVLVLGNHEFYMRFFPDSLAGYKEVAESIKDVHLLERESVFINRVRFLGCTLWSDLANGRQMDACRRFMNDYQVVYSSDGTPLTPEETMRQHRDSIDWLDKEFRVPFLGRTVMVTHHAPSFKSQHPKYAGSQVSGAFCSNLDEKVRDWAPAAIIHGHLHDVVSYDIGATTVLCNPWGYPGEHIPSFKYLEV